MTAGLTVQVECGRKQPSQVTIFQIAKALATTPAQLLVATELKLNLSPTV